ncbi:hypothetical protein DICPUDRAFT_155352 [Dictyostelium purpureum]|uniref:Diaminopimelate epimerase n=1 Tax=Dictyostelium purpureum TaxID=5786 RepID=F0ZTS0_DICPU|nr:uncharacterized protein DICPUDRAFT_155352 [Dictyostelium purpureum]EGC32655.1 hypothetical protein DICPUDRAFT_155352 [Dictyostelium purpureum]|eukprot:XP_003290824.1 hypothetical protein DICPUDRAFT_155352 [Dictyostelium purpureum]
MEPINNSIIYRVKFSKMHGAGNDFVCFETNKVERINSFDKSEISLKELKDISLILADRKYGVGCDQLIICNNNPKVEKSAHYEMIVINSDGQQATMCGNGVRCFSKFVIDNKIESKSLNGTPKKDETTSEIEQKVETLAGLIITYPQIYHHLNTRNVMMVKVNMGNALVLKTNKWKESYGTVLNNKQSIDKSAYLETVELNLPNCKQLECVLVSMGNPHCIVFLQRNIELGYLNKEECSNLKTMKIEDIAVALQKHPLFTDSCNVEFVYQSNENKLSNTVISRVYERGAGETLACGTGASAVAVASILMGHCDSEKEVTCSMPGGDLLIQWGSGNKNVFKTGPACTVFSSQIDIEINRQIE